MKLSIVILVALCLIITFVSGCGNNNGSTATVAASSNKKDAKQIVPSSSVSVSAQKDTKSSKTIRQLGDKKLTITGVVEQVSYFDNTTLVKFVDGETVVISDGYFSIPLGKRVEIKGYWENYTMWERYDNLVKIRRV
jgi:hypothetical protein